MGYNTQDSMKRGNSDNHGFRQPKPLNNAKKWNGKKSGKGNGAATMGVQQQYKPCMPFAFQNIPAQAYFKAGPVETPFKNHGLRSRNRLKRRRVLAKKKLYSSPLCAPLAPRNTTSFIMRAKKLGGIAPAVTPSPATPAVLATPFLSPGMRDKVSLDEMNKELGVDGYGSMNGLIRLRSYQERAREVSESESDVDQVDLLNGDQSLQSVERLEQRIDQGLSRFEMIYPSHVTDADAPKNLESCVNSQERLISQLEEENLTLKERLFLVEQELNELRQRIHQLEGGNHLDESMDEQCEESCGDVSAPCN